MPTGKEVSSLPPQTNDANKGAANLTPAQVIARLSREELARTEAEPVTEKVAEVEAKAQAEAETPETPVATVAESDKAESAETKPEEAQAPAAETTAESEKPEGEDDDVLSHKSPLDHNLKDRIQKRIDKEVKKTKDLEREIEALRQRLTETQPTTPLEQQTSVPIVPLPVGAPPLANVADVNQLLQLQQQAKEAVRWAEEQLDRDDIESGVQVGDRVFSKHDLKTIMRNAKVKIEDEIPQRYNFLVQKNQFQQQAYQQFPFLKDKSTPEYYEAQQAYRQYPWLQNLPNADMIIGVQIEGMKALKERAESKAKLAKEPVKPRTKPPGDQTPSPASMSESRSPAISPAKKALEAERAKIMSKKGISGKEAADYLMKKELSNNR